MLKQLNNKKIGVFRALDLRVVQAEYAMAFRRLTGFFVSNQQREITAFFKADSRRWLRLGLRAPFILDPVSLITGTTSHRSWLEYEQKQLELIIKKMDLCQIQEPFFLYSGQVAKYTKKLNKPLITAPWMCFNHLSTYIPPYAWSVRQVMEKTDLFILRTKRVNRYLDVFKVPERKRVLIYHGVNTRRFYPGKKKPGDKVRILFAGVLHQSKGINDLLAVWPEVVKAVGKKKVELVVCGQGAEAEKVKTMAKVWPIKFLGYVTNLKMPEVYRQADIFCGPSKTASCLGMKLWEEGFGFVFAEAMASGLPVVTNDCGAIKELVGEQNFINRQGDLKALEAALITLIKDQRLRQKLGQVNRQRVLERFNLVRQVRKEEQILAKAGLISYDINK